jgi:DNA-binding response OmpR family regulator
VASQRASPETLNVGELEIRLADGLVLAAGAPMTLSVREFELLVALARRSGTILTREELFATVWGGELRAGDRSVDVYVSKLRAKLERAMPDRRFIHTHPGFGYRFQAQPTREAAAALTGTETARADSSVNGLSHDLHTSATGT